MDNSFDSPAEILFEEASGRKFPWVNVALFGLTCLSTLVVGTVLMGLPDHLQYFLPVCLSAWPS